MPGFVVLAYPRGDGDPAMRLGITVSKKVDTRAVVRNRMKRRFRELARALLADHGVAGADHVLIGRAGGNDRDWASLQADFVKACAKLRRDISSRRDLPASLVTGRAGDGSARKEPARPPRTNPPPHPPSSGRGDERGRGGE